MPYSPTANPNEGNAVPEDVHLTPSISNPSLPHTYVGIENTYHSPTLLATGKEGNVYHVHSTKTTTTYALKTAASPATSHNLKTEIHLLSHLNHATPPFPPPKNNPTANTLPPQPSIMPHLDHDIPSTFLITPFYPLLTLRHQHTLHPLSPSETTTLLHALLSTCAYLSAQELIHRDIKPENILVASRPSHPSDKPYNSLKIKLTDFGRCISSSPSLDKTNVVERAGTVIYAAPEAFGADGVWTDRSDVWSGALVVLECAIVPWPGGWMPGREMIGEVEPFGAGSAFAGGWRGGVRWVLEGWLIGGGGDGGMGVGGEVGFGRGFGEVVEEMLRVEVGERIGAEEALRRVEGLEGWGGGL